MTEPWPWWLEEVPDADKAELILKGHCRECLHHPTKPSQTQSIVEDDSIPPPGSSFDGSAFAVTTKLWDIHYEGCSKYEGWYSYEELKRKLRNG